PRGVDPLRFDQNDAGVIATLAIGPDPRIDVVDRVDDVLRPIVTVLPVVAVRRVTTDRHRDIQSKVEPVKGLLDARAALRPYRTFILSADQNPMRQVGDAGKRHPWRRHAEMKRAVREKVLARHLGRNGIPVSAVPRGNALHVAAGWRNPVEINVGLARDEVADTIRPDAEAIDLLEGPGAVGHERLPTLLTRCRWRNAVGVP